MLDGGGVNQILSVGVNSNVTLLPGLALNDGVAAGHFLRNDQISYPDGGAVYLAGNSSLTANGASLPYAPGCP